MTDSLKAAKSALLLAQIDMDIIADSSNEFEFRFLGATKGTEKVGSTYGKIQGIRRYLHLNFPLNVLVFQDGLAFKTQDENGAPVVNPLEHIDDPKAIEAIVSPDTELTARFLLQPRASEYKFKRGEYSNLLLEPNPTYTNVNPSLQANVVDEYDNIDDSTIDNTFDLEQFIKDHNDPKLVLTGTLYEDDGLAKAANRTEIEEALLTLGIESQKSVTHDTDIVIMATNPGPNKLTMAKKLNKRIVSGSVFLNEMRRLGKLPEATENVD